VNYLFDDSRVKKYMFNAQYIFDVDFHDESEESAAESEE
jgi:hypothetical protein